MNSSTPASDPTIANSPPWRCRRRVGSSYYNSMALRVTLLLVLLWWSWPGAVLVRGQPSRFFFPNFSPDPNPHARLTKIGSSFVLYGQLQLTPDSELAPAPMTVGKAFYAERIRFLDPTTKQAASFSTYFTFSINNLSCARQLCGDGLAFLISPDDHSLGTFGGNLGIYNSSTAGGGRPVLANTIAIEFDTYKNLAPIQDMDDNHVGINLENATSEVAVSANNVDINLKDGSELTAWIDYESENQSLQVRIGRNSSNKPSEALIDYKINLTEIVDDFMYVGFAAATGDYFELHTILSWSFVSHAKEPVPPPADDLEPKPWDMPIPLPSSPPSSPSKASLSNVLTGLVVGLPIGVAVMILICAFFLLGKRRKLWILRRKSQDTGDSALYGRESFRYKQLSVATKGFSDKEKLGNGSGNMYRGVLASTGAVVAIKRIRDVNTKQEKEVYAELSTLTQLHHRNLVQLLGWCRDRGKYILVYEFMPLGSLSKALYQDMEAGETLSWSQRFNIITGLAEALNYLHGGYHQQVMHRNVKPSSILLDDQSNAKLGDYGLIDEQGKRKGDAQHTDSFGYTAPEAFQTGKGSIKADVYSFGAVALETACGRRPIEGAFSAEEIFIVDWVWGLHSHGRITAAADKRLGGEFVAAQVQAVLLIGLLCSQPDPAQRPSMRQVMKYLAGDTPIPPAPRPLSSFQPTLAAGTSSGKSARRFFQNS